MKKTSTLVNFADQFLQNKKNKTEIKLIEIKPNDHSIQMILSYSRSLSCTETKSIGPVLIVNN